MNSWRASLKPPFTSIKSGGPPPHFPDLGDPEDSEGKLTRDLFCFGENILAGNSQKEFLKIKGNSTATDDFEAMQLTDFRTKYGHTI